MRDDEILDWTLSRTPADDEAAAEQRPLPDGPAPEDPSGSGNAPNSPKKTTWQRLGRRGWAALLALALVALVGGYAFTRIGFARIEAQIAAEVAYEDAQSLAGNVAAVLAVQSDESGHWLSLREAEAALGWPAAQPAAGLLPADEPPRVVAVKSLGEGIFEATVLRTWVNSAGQRSSFALGQRYRNLGPGVWVRLAPDEAGLEAGLSWAGRRLDAYYPEVDHAWMLAHLPLVDAALDEACAHWGNACSAELRVFYSFMARAALPLAVPSAGNGGQAKAGDGLDGPYPLTFDIAPTLLSPPRGVALASPNAAGVPQDEAASQALVRAITVRGLVYLADVAAGRGTRRYDLLRDALAAREEIRQGLSPAPSYALHPRHYRPAGELWTITRLSGGDPAVDVLYRLQALQLVEFIASDQPTVSDGTLLANMRGHPDLLNWFNAVYGMAEGPQLLARYEASVAADFEQRLAELPWERLEGLMYVCGQQVWQVHVGRPVALPLATTPPRRTLALASTPYRPTAALWHTRMCRAMAAPICTSSTWMTTASVICTRPAAYCPWAGRRPASSSIWSRRPKAVAAFTPARWR